MNSITSSRVERPPGSPGHWSIAATTRYPSAGAADDANTQPTDWLAAAAQARPTSVYVSSESNEAPEIDSGLLSLAKAAQKRWLKENPF